MTAPISIISIHHYIYPWFCTQWSTRAAAACLLSTLMSVVRRHIRDWARRSRFTWALFPHKQWPVSPAMKWLQILCVYVCDRERLMRLGPRASVVGCSGTCCCLCFCLHWDMNAWWLVLGFAGCRNFYLGIWPFMFLPYIPGAKQITEEILYLEGQISATINFVAVVLVVYLCSNKAVQNALHDETVIKRKKDITLQRQNKLKL